MYPLAIINDIKDELIKRNSSIAVAESVTAGHLQAALSLAENATCFFQGGMTVYNLGQKTRHLHVDPMEAERNNCVSEAISRKMSLSVAQLFVADYGIGITGYAAAVPERGIEKLFAYYAISCNGMILDSGRFDAPQKEALEVQLFYAAAVLHKFKSLL